MQRKALAIVFLSLVLLVAILLGYWDMLSSEKLRVSQAEKAGTSQQVAVAQRNAEEGQSTPTRPGTAGANDASDDAGNGTSAAVSPDKASPDMTARIAPNDDRAVVEAEIAGKDDAAVTGKPEGRPAAGVSGSPMPPSSADDAEQTADLAVPGEGEAATDIAESTADAQVRNSVGTPESESADPPAEEAVTDDAPLFDLLRVEPDGSTLIAGRSVPGSRITLHDGKTTIGDDMANAAGEFVLVLPKPLQPGDHAIKIVATTPDGATKTSRETAVVSVPPTGREGDLLAMVEAPDQPSRLISVPNSLRDQTAGSDPDTAEMEDDAGDAALVRAGSRGSSSPHDAADKAVGIDTGDAEIAAAQDASSQADANNPVEQAATPTLRIEAVEVEGGKIFVAGAADAGSSVRVYLDNSLLAEDRTGADDRFLATAEREVSVGDHLVRADQVNAEGEVTARAEVPFTRPAGEAVAAIAPPTDAVPAGGEPANTADLMAMAEGPGPIERADTGKLTPPAPTDAPQAAAGTIVADPSPSTPWQGEAGAPSSQSQDGGKRRSAALSSEGRPADMSGAALATGSDMSLGERSAERSAVRDEAEGSDLSAIVASEMPASGSEPDATERRTASRQESTEEDVIVSVTRQEPLATAAGRVIIRKGDTLWAISRETYGRGSRYTAIYFANGNRIRDPDLIYPGQIFRLPPAEDDSQEQGAVGAGQGD